ncbi:MAG: histidine--tRNA ligase [Mycoplasmoidaceae bacterium]|nr:MAG: histidine--tRNA ligase [Mycoplasmoidaceae bacterium]
MNKQINKPRGTQDIYGNKASTYNFLFTKFSNIAKTFGYGEIKIPMIEHIETFVRTVGETSDIVKKEMYNFKDKGDREIALRPEGTAGVVRAVVEDKLLYKEALPIRFYYYGSMFRYERPQSKRLREFNQFGVELIGTNSVYDDFNVIKFVNECMESVNIKGTTIMINNLGSFESRAKWIDELKKYFKPYEKQLSELNRERLSKNPTRILDDKEDGVKDFVKKAPKVSNFLSKQEKDDFAMLLSLLKAFGIKYELDDNLVRGLDYYTGMVFEVKDKNNLALGGGGRYAKMVEEFGGDDQSCIGMALGVDRIINYIEENKIKCGFASEDVQVVFTSLEQKFNNKALEYMLDTISNGISAVSNFSINKLAKVFSYAEKLNASYVVIIGEKEVKEKTITYKNIKTKVQKTSSFKDFIKIFNKK